MRTKEIETQLNTLQIEYESEKKIAAETLQSCNNKFTNSEQKLLEAQKMIADLESNLISIKEENVKSLKEIQGM